MLHQVPQTLSVPLLRIRAFQVPLEMENLMPESHQDEDGNVTFASYINKLLAKLQGALCVFYKKGVLDLMKNRSLLRNILLIYDLAIQSTTLS